LEATVAITPDALKLTWKSRTAGCMFAHYGTLLL